MLSGGLELTWSTRSSSAVRTEMSVACTAASGCMPDITDMNSERPSETAQQQVSHHTLAW